MNFFPSGSGLLDDRKLLRCRLGDFGRRSGGSGLRRGQIFIAQTSSALETAAKLLEAFRAADVSALRVNLLQLCGKFRGAAIVACAKDEIQELLERRGVARRSSEDSIEQTYGFLRESVTRKEVNIRQRLRNEFLCFVVKLAVRGIPSGLCSYLWGLSVRGQFWSSRPHQIDGQVLFFLVLGLRDGGLFGDVIPKFA